MAGQQAIYCAAPGTMDSWSLPNSAPGEEKIVWSVHGLTGVRMRASPAATEEVKAAACATCRMTPVGSGAPYRAPVLLTSSQASAQTVVSHGRCTVANDAEQQTAPRTDSRCGASSKRTVPRSPGHGKRRLRRKTAPDPALSGWNHVGKVVLGKE